MLELLAELIRNRCVNPLGGEMRPIRSIERYLRAHGVKSLICKSAPGRGGPTMVRLMPLK